MCRHWIGDFEECMKKREERGGRLNELIPSIYSYLVSAS